jgi:predicted O-methyltransferase YrrM
MYTFSSSQNTKRGVLKESSFSTKLIELAHQLNSAEFGSILKKHIDFKGFGQKITDPQETSFMELFIREFKAQSALEIGTFFASTSYLIAKAGSEDFKLVTIDPYGGDRVPKILSTFPEDLSRRIIFSEVYSMEFFAKVEAICTTNNIPKFDLIFIDGSHDYPSVLFDIYNSALNLSDSGLIILDNFDQRDVKNAVVDFARQNPDWKVISSTKENNLNEAQQIVIDCMNRTWCGLVQPDYVAITKRHTSFKFKLEGPAVEQLRINLIEGRPGILGMWVTLGSWPFDFHITGENLKIRNLSFEKELNGSESTVIVDIADSMEEFRNDSDCYFTVEVELAFSESQNQSLKLNKRIPVVLQ